MSSTANLSDEFQAAAALCAERFPRAAGALRELAESEPMPAPSVRERRRLLRLLRTQLYFRFSRSAAARAIATSWAEWNQPELRRHRPRGLVFRRLAEAGFQPIAWRQIYDDITK